MALVGCSTTLEVGDTAIICDRDADCPAGRCELLIQRCVGIGSGTLLRMTSASATSVVRVAAAFNQAVAPGSLVDVSQVHIEPALEVSSFVVDDGGRRLALTTAPQSFDVTYTLTVRGLVSDRGDPLDDDARTQSFVSFLGRAESDPPATVQPADGSVVTTATAELTWQPVFGATSYIVEVRRREDGPAAAASVYTTSSSGPPLVVAAIPREGTYDWRVRADVTAAGVYGHASFDRLVDAVYVACPADVTCAPRVGNGSRRAPTQRVGDGIQIATQLGLPEVRVAARAGDVAYDEAIVLADTTLAVDGGFDERFASSPRRARISRLGTVIVARPAPGTLHLRNLSLHAYASSAIEVVSIEGPVDIAFNDVDIGADPARDSARGITINGIPGVARVELANVDVTVGPAGQSVAAATSIGILARDAALTIEATTVRVGIPYDLPRAGTHTGVRLENNSSIIAHALDVGVANGTDGTAFDDARPGLPSGAAAALDMIDSARLWVSIARESITGLRVAERRSLVLSNSVVAVGSSG